MKITHAVSALIAAAFTISTASAQVNYQTVTIGNPGNANDTTGLGGVAYTFNIGTYDVTVSQYTTFLNAVAATDTYNLYNTSMASNLNIAGISRSGVSGSYSYSVIGTSGNRPITYVSWFDAARMANWVQNGQGSGSTETGAYTLNGATSGVGFTKNTNATWWIPSENDWYKAAYYDPVNPGADANGTTDYWLYATQSDTAPGNNALNPTLPNQANYRIGTTYSVTQTSSVAGVNALTDVGTFTNSASAYGTYDQSGDVYQWNDAVIGSSRGRRGGSWVLLRASPLQSSSRGSSDPSNEDDFFGFRLATVPVPEPSTWLTGLALVGVGAFGMRRRF